MTTDATIEVRYSDADGGERRARIGFDATLLDAAQAAGVDMEATCGGRGRCRSCRVKVLRGEVPPPTMQDTIQLGHEEVQERFRLACQTRALTDCEVMAMPPRAESGHQILTGSSTEMPGLVMDSGVRKQLVHASAPKEEHHQTSDIDEILEVLDTPVDRRVPLNVLRRVPLLLRQERGALTVTTFNDQVIHIEAGDTTEHAYGMAFDIGTTSIVGTLMNLATGEEMAAVGSVNPQTVYGGDLMSRIAYAQFDEKKLVTLRAKVLTAINDFIKEACARSGVDRDHIYKIIVVGNTCMHHIFLGIDVSYVGLAPYAPAVRESMVVPAPDLPLKGAPNAQVCLLPIVAGFVGADTMACVLSTRIYDSDELRALVDIGTNGEVVMGLKDGLMACSAPAGPALEGAQIRHGMRGAIGAIEDVSIDEDVHCGVIGAAPAIGICGSGLIDACAKMVGAGVMDTSGRLRKKKKREELPEAVASRFRDSADGSEFVLVWQDAAGKDVDVTLTQGDIRQLQLAKSAIYSGIVMLQQAMEISDDDLHQVMLCGGFGNYISIESAVTIRLLPSLALERISYVGNAAHMGAQMALLSETERSRADELAQRIEHVALAARPEFQDIFIAGMGFNMPAETDSASPGAQAAATTVSLEALNMRVNLLFGFLGSGKTTLVRRILAERSGGKPMAVIVNEFGEVGVDGDIIAGKSVDLVELTSGCLCCTLRGSLMTAVEELRERAGVEQIVVEATGVASPGDMLEDLAESNVRSELDVGPVVTVVDAPKFTRLKEMLGDFYQEQVENADVLVLNKIDLADAGELQAAEAAVRAINPDAVLLYAEQGDTDLAQILDGPVSELYAQVLSDLGHDLPTPAHQHDHQHDHGHGHSHAPATSFVLDADGDFDGAALRRAFESLPDAVWRVKGFLEVDGGTSLLQYTMGQLEITPSEPRSRAYLVVIGDSPDRESVTQILLSARREAH